MSTLEEQLARAEAEADRKSRYDAHREEQRAAKQAVGARARAEARLQEAFERDLISLDALEARLSLVNKAGTAAEIDAALVEIPDVAEAGAGERALVARDVPASGWAVGIFGSANRTGRWRVPRKLRAVSCFGSCELDFTRADLGPITDVHCVSVFGAIEIRVPAGIRVESSGGGILGSFEHRDAAERPGEGPVLRIHGAAILGAVEVKTIAE